MPHRIRGFAAHVVDVVIPERGVHRQHEQPCEQRLGVGQILREPELAELMDGLSAPLDQRSDAVLLQVGFQRVALLGFDLVVLKDIEVVRIIVRSGGQAKLRQIAKLFPVARGDLPPAGDGVVVGAELVVEYGGLEVVETRIESPDDNLARRVAAVVPQQKKGVADGVLIGHRAAAIAETSECLGRIETDRAGNSESSSTLAFESRTEPLRSVLHDEDRMAACDCRQRIHVGRAPVELRRHDGLGPRRDGGLDRCRIDQVIWPTLDRHRSRSGKMNGGGCSHHGVGGEDHFVARDDARRTDSQVQRIGGVGHSDDVFHAEISRQVLFERLEVALENKRAATADIREDFEMLFFLRSEHRGIVEELNRFGSNGCFHVIFFKPFR